MKIRRIAGLCAIGLMLIVAMSTVVVADDPTADQVQAAIDVADEAWTGLAAEIEASELDRNDARKIGALMNRAERGLEKAQMRLGDGQLRGASRDVEESLQEIDTARQRLEAATSAGGAS